MSVKWWWGGGLESHTNPARPVAPEQLDAFLRYQFFRLWPAGVHRMLESTSGMMLNLDEVNESADSSARQQVERFNGRNTSAALKSQAVPVCSVTLHLHVGQKRLRSD